MSTTPNLGLTQLDAGLKQPEVVINANNLILDALGDALASWTPIWTNLTIGNGIVTAKFKQTGKIVFCRLSIIFGSTSVISGPVSFSLPVTQSTYAGRAGLTPLGLARYFDTSAPAGYEGSIVNASMTTGLLIAGDASGTYLKGADLSSTVPFTWTTSDEIAVQFSYEAL